MKKYTNFILKNLWPLWLGCSIGMCGITPLDWRFYVIVVPVIILVALSTWVEVKETIMRIHSRKEGEINASIRTHD
jgi:hypothetical protein